MVEAVSGFAGGRVANPTYAQVTAGRHRPSRGGAGDLRSGAHLLRPAGPRASCRTIDPTDAGGQFCDRGGSYRTAIFAPIRRQRRAAEAARAEANRILRRAGGDAGARRRAFLSGRGLSPGLCAAQRAQLRPLPARLRQGRAAQGSVGRSGGGALARAAQCAESIRRRLTTPSSLHQRCSEFRGASGNAGYRALGIAEQSSASRPPRDGRTASVSRRSRTKRSIIRLRLAPEAAGQRPAGVVAHIISVLRERGLPARRRGRTDAIAMALRIIDAPRSGGDGRLSAHSLFVKSRRKAPARQIRASPAKRSARRPAASPRSTTRSRSAGPGQHVGHQRDRRRCRTPAGAARALCAGRLHSSPRAQREAVGAELRGRSSRQLRAFARRRCAANKRPGPSAGRRGRQPCRRGGGDRRLPCSSYRPLFRALRGIARGDASTSARRPYRPKSGRSARGQDA